jgi:hypothetical protein
MNNSIKVLNNLYKEASIGNFQKIKSIIDKNKFSQQEIDEAFRQYIHNNKKEKDSFENCIKLFLKNIQEINFRNPKYNNTTILMYSIDESQDAAINLIISEHKDNLDMNLTDSNGENTLFHLINNDKFSTITKIKFIKNFFLNDYILNSKNNKNETIPNILNSRDCLDLLKEIQNKIKENKFDQNKLTSLYNNKQYNELLEIIEKYEKNQNNDKQNILINKYSINYNISFLSLKIKINSLILKNKNYYDNLQNQPINFFIEIKEISNYTCMLMDVLKKVDFEPKGGNNQFSLCLIINKMILYYQLDLYKDFCLLKNNIEASGNIYLNNNLFFNLYKYFINIDMMMQRGLYSEANTELAILKKNISENKYLVEGKQSNENNSKNKKVVILPNDLIFKVNELNKLTNLYQIFINSYIKYKNSNECSALIKELKDIKIEEPENKEKDKDKEKEKDNLSNSNNNLKSFQKYLLLRLNYLNNVAKNPNGKISYKINDKLLMLNIEGNSLENELNKIYYYHYQGIISLKNEKYNISSYFFFKCLKIITKKTSMQLIKRNHFYPAILFNLALSYFYSKKYRRTIEYLYILLNYSNNRSKFFINYKYIYYRLGLSNLEILLHEDKNTNLLYNSYIKKKFILRTSSKSYLNEKNDIIEYFKKTFRLIRNDPNDSIYFSTLINLVFSLIIKENYIEAVFYLKLNKSKERNNLNIINCYLIQCYIYLNRIDLAEKKSKEIILDEKSFKVNNREIKFYERLNSKLVSVKGLKLGMLINLIKLCAMKKNIKEMQQYLILILDSINFNITVDEKGKIITNEEMPAYIINVFVYYYLIINRKDLALNILKKRKIDEILITSDIK